MSFVHFCVSFFIMKLHKEHAKILNNEIWFGSPPPSGISHWFIAYNYDDSYIMTECTKLV